MADVQVTIVVVFSDGSKCMIPGFTREEAETELAKIADHIGSVGQITVAKKAALFMRDARYAFLAYRDGTPMD